MYVHQKGLANGAESWECEHRRKKTCKARVLHILNDQIIHRVNDHTHGPNKDKIEVTKIRVDMKRRAETTIDLPQRILSDGLPQASAGAAVSLPLVENVRRTIRRYRANVGDPINPRDRANIPVLPNEFTLTNNGNRFLLHDSGVGDPNRLLIFATDEGTHLLEHSDHWFGDGTFSVSPAIFYQVYTLHAICHGKVIPCVYALQYFLDYPFLD